MRGPARDGVGAGGGIGRVVPVAVLALVPWWGGCATGEPSGDAAAWTPPRGGLVTHELAADSADLAGRSDARLGHLPRQGTVFSATRIDVRSRLSTTWRGRITDRITRRVWTTTIITPR